MTQPSLFRKAPTVSEQDVAWMVWALTGRGWLPAKKLAIYVNDRMLRAIAAASDGRIISGQKGYCLIEEATVEEVQRFCASMRSQAKRMLERAAQTEKAMHKRSAA